MERLLPLRDGATVCIDELGDPDGPPVVHVEGHMAQLVSTPQSYCERLADHGFRVVRVDNRDVGRSSRFPDDPYTLEDMAEDVHDVVGHLGGPAVVCGRSMGGAIAQLLALSHPEDVTGLALFYTYAKEPGGPGDVPPSAGPTPSPFDDLDSFVAWEQAALPGIAGPDHPFSASDIDELARLMWARGVSWAGFERQRMAMARQDAWSPRLAEIAVPTVVVHGEEDPVIPVAAGRRLAELIPGSTLSLVPGLGHRQPPALDDLFVAATLRAAGR